MATKIVVAVAAVLALAISGTVGVAYYSDRLFDSARPQPSVERPAAPRSQPSVHRGSGVRQLAAAPAYDQSQVGGVLRAPGR